MATRSIKYNKESLSADSILADIKGRQRVELRRLHNMRQESITASNLISRMTACNAFIDKLDVLYKAYSTILAELPELAAPINVLNEYIITSRPRKTTPHHYKLHTSELRVDINNRRRAIENIRISAGGVKSIQAEIKVVLDYFQGVQQAESGRLDALRNVDELTIQVEFDEWGSF